jgi:hypothetical protein
MLPLGRVALPDGHFEITTSRDEASIAGPAGHGARPRTVGVADDETDAFAPVAHEIRA